MAENAPVAAETLPATKPGGNDAVQDCSSIQQGLMSLLNPSISSLDNKVLNVKRSQSELSAAIDSISSDLGRIADSIPNPHQLDAPIKKLTNARRKINVVNSILQNCQERLRRVHSGVAKENALRHAQLAQQTQQLNIQAQVSSPSQPQPNTQALSPSHTASHPSSQPSTEETTVVTQADVHEVEEAEPKSMGSDNLSNTEPVEQSAERAELPEPATTNEHSTETALSDSMQSKPQTTVVEQH